MMARKIPAPAAGHKGSMPAFSMRARPTERPDGARAPKRGAPDIPTLKTESMRAGSARGRASRRCRAFPPSKKSRDRTDTPRGRRGHGGSRGGSGQNSRRLVGSRDQAAGRLRNALDRWRGGFIDNDPVGAHAGRAERGFKRSFRQRFADSVRAHA